MDVLWHIGCAQITLFKTIYLKKKQGWGISDIYSVALNTPTVDFNWWQQNASHSGRLQYFKFLLRDPSRQP